MRFRPRPSVDRYRGVLLGTMTGDALGMPVEGWPARAIRAEHGVLRQLLPARLGRGLEAGDAGRGYARELADRMHHAFTQPPD